MSDLRLVAVQTHFVLRVMLRNPSGPVFTLAFPILLLVLFNSIFAGGDQTTEFSGGRIETSAYFTAGLLAYTIMLSAFTTPLMSIVTQREQGQLKRLRGTPLPAWTFIAAQVARSTILVVAMTVILLGIGRVAFGVEVRAGAYVGIAAYVLLGTAAMAGPALALSPFTKNADAASAVGPFAAVVLSFISGVFIPVEALPGWLEEVGAVFPLAHLADGLQSTVAFGASGTGLAAGNVAVLALWAIAGVAVAARRFVWDPQAYR